MLPAELRVHLGNRRARVSARRPRAPSPVSSATLRTAATATVTIEGTPTVVTAIGNTATVDGNQARRNTRQQLRQREHRRFIPPPADTRGPRALRRCGVARARLQRSARRRTARTGRRWRSRPATRRCSPPAHSPSERRTPTVRRPTPPAASASTSFPGNPTRPRTRRTSGHLHGITDVRRASDLLDYTGDIQERFDLRDY